MMSAAKKRHKSMVIQAAGGLVWREVHGDRQIAVVHRPRYDDWSFPKGIVEKDETWEAAARREVGEETGCKTQLGDFVGCNCYTVEGRPKVVLFWQMIVVEEHAYPRHSEVDQVVWLPVKNALELLSYNNEKVLLQAVLEDHP